MKKTKGKTGERLKTGFFNFRQFGNDYLVTNEAGDFAFLEKTDFELLTQGRITLSHPKAEELLGKSFVFENKGPSERLSTKYMHRKNFVFSGPNLFILVATLRCNMNCVYCHAGAGGRKSTELDMTPETARRIVDLVFQSPSSSCSIEFQGGEPLLNWDVMKEVIQYSLDKNQEAARSIYLTVVSNLSLLDREKEDFLIGNRIGICTSLDGPEKVHNANRGGGYRSTVKKLKSLLHRCKIEFDRYLPAALTTVTRHSLPYYREIIDTYVNLGLEAIHLRQLNPVGFAAPALKEIGYSPQEFIDFYEKSLDYIIELNKQGTVMVDRTAWIFLAKIFNEYDPGFLDLRSPCGAGIGQVAFNYNGDVFTCDEGRMLSVQGDDSFRMGNVYEHTWDDLLGSEIVKLTCLNSMIEGIPHCHSCAYMPYCGVCPLLNYVEDGSLFTRIPENRRHVINQGILDILFRRIRNESDMEVFMNWLRAGIIVT